MLLLRLEDGTELAAPSALTLEATIRGLGGRGNSFAVLSRDAAHFIQTAVTRGQLVLERQDGSLDAHYEAEGPLDRSAVIAAFQRHFVPDRVTGVLDEATSVRLNTVAKLVALDRGDPWADF